MLADIDDLKVVIVLSSEDNFFYDCVGDNINIPAFKKLWAEYTETIRTALLFLKV